MYVCEYLDASYYDTVKADHDVVAYVQIKDKWKLRHRHNGKEYRLPELQCYSVDGYCEETKTVHEFLGCFWHGHTCLSFRDRVIDRDNETLDDRYKQTMDRLEQITGAGYQVQMMWECGFRTYSHKFLHTSFGDGWTIEDLQCPLRWSNEAMRLHYMVRTGEKTIRYTDIMSLYPYICKHY